MFFVSDKKIVFFVSEKKKYSRISRIFKFAFFLPKVDFYIGMISMLCYTMDY